MSKKIIVAGQKRLLRTVELFTATLINSGASVRERMCVCDRESERERERGMRGQ